MWWHSIRRRGPRIRPTAYRSCAGTTEIVRSGCRRSVFCRSGSFRGASSIWAIRSWMPEFLWEWYQKSPYSTKDRRSWHSWSMRPQRNRKNKTPFFIFITHSAVYPARRCSRLLRSHRIELFTIDEALDTHYNLSTNPSCSILSMYPSSLPISRGDPVAGLGVTS